MSDRIELYSCDIPRQKDKDWKDFYNPSDDVFGKNVIAVFGGTGSLGTIMVENLLCLNPLKILIVCNNENEIWESKNYFMRHELIDWIFCDIRDFKELEKIFMGYRPNLVFNCAALKHIGFCEDFVMNAIKTNILGLENLLYLSNNYGVRKFVQISTDKAVEPISVMGATKFIGERMCKAWNSNRFNVSVVRLGNVLESRGSLIPQIRNDMKRLGEIFITDKEMERFFITKEDVSLFIEKVVSEMKGGEIFIPKLTLRKIMDIVNPILEESPLRTKTNFIGRKFNEKLKEKLYSEYEFVIDLDWCYKIE